MLSERAFRAQLATQGQRELYGLAANCGISHAGPLRHQSFQRPQVLPCVGLIDLTEGLGEARFRLAGTWLRDVYGEAGTTGKRIDRVFAGACADYWHDIHARVAEEGLPPHGVVRGPARGRHRIASFW